jgi:hypothetical protein
MNEHLSPSDLELFVIDGLDAVLASRVEAHVLGCRECGEALAREARLEVDLEEVARRAARPVLVEATRRSRPAPVRPPRLGFALAAAGGALSLAAAWMLFATPVTGTRQIDAIGRTATASDATVVALDGRNGDPLDGG